METNRAADLRHSVTVIEVGTTDRFVPRISRGLFASVQDRFQQWAIGEPFPFGDLPHVSNPFQMRAMCLHKRSITTKRGICGLVTRWDFSDRCSHKGTITASGLVIIVSELRKDPMRPEQVWARSEACCRSIATPSIVLRASDDAGLHGIQHDVTNDLQQMLISLHQHCLEAPLKQVADTAVSPVVTLGIHTIQLAHPPREVGLERFDKEMVVVAH